MSLTDATVRSAKPGEKSVKLFDERGLYLEVSPNGGKWWRLKYRHGGKEKRISLGIYPDVGLKDARQPVTLNLGAVQHRQLPDALTNPRKPWQAI